MSCMGYILNEKTWFHHYQVSSVITNLITNFIVVSCWKLLYRISVYEWIIERMRGLVWQNRNKTGNIWLRSENYGTFLNAKFFQATDIIKIYLFIEAIEIVDHLLLRNLNSFDDLPLDHCKNLPSSWTNSER